MDPQYLDGYLVIQVKYCCVFQWIRRTLLVHRERAAHATEGSKIKIEHAQIINYHKTNNYHNGNYQN